MQRESISEGNALVKVKSNRREKTRKPEMLNNLVGVSNKGGEIGDGEGREKEGSATAPVVCARELLWRL
eukprot:5605989-Pleurochrysis_carterae.AAC.1